jgi:hypothetical protein
MTKASADADKFGATGRRVHKEPGMPAWLSWQVEAALSYVIMVSCLPDHGNSAV